MNVAEASLSAAKAYANTGYGPQFAVLEIGLADRVAVVEPDEAFWAIVQRDSLPAALAGPLIRDFQKNAGEFQKEMARLRFGLKPSAVYFNPTDRCNLNCSYCYLPERMRRKGRTMTAEELCVGLQRLLTYFQGVRTNGVKPQIIFHGSEPMLARDAVFAGIRRFQEDFHFGVQTNATLLDEASIAFLMEHEVGIGISLDGPTARVANKTRKNWRNEGTFRRVAGILKKLAGYPAFNVITTVTKLNCHSLVAMVNFYHEQGVKIVMFNPVRCTLEGGKKLKPDNATLADSFCRALDRAFELYKKTGHKVVVANFANILAGITGPTTRRLMCDISPCGGGRCFFAVSASGDIFPCSEFIGLAPLKAGNLYRDSIPAILQSRPFKEITERKVEAIAPCATCAIRHFCGAPCPAEIRAVSGTVHAPSPYCEFYEQIVRYAFRVIAEGQEEAYLWDGWKEDTKETFCWM